MLSRGLLEWRALVCLSNLELSREIVRLEMIKRQYV
jgi:hypothetical protein